MSDHKVCNKGGQLRKLAGRREGNRGRKKQSVPKNVMGTIDHGCKNYIPARGNRGPYRGSGQEYAEKKKRCQQRGKPGMKTKPNHGEKLIGKRFEEEKGKRSLQRSKL